MKNRLNLNNYIQDNFSNLSYGKFLLLETFYESIKDFKLPEEINIAVVSGGRNQAEIVVLNQMGFKTDVTLFGIEDDEVFFDLNKVNLTANNKFFDLIICTQTLEHIWNHDNFFNNLRLLAKQKSILYLNCPKSNKVHMAPIYYSSGFTSSYLKKNLENKDFNIIKSGELGGEVLYKSIHMTQSWYTKENVKNRYRFNKNKLFYKLKHLIKFSNLGQYLVLKRNLDR